MSSPAPNQFALLKTRRFLPVFLVQFLGAFNDQVYQKAFVALITYRLADEVGMEFSRVPSEDHTVMRPIPQSFT